MNTFWDRVATIHRNTRVMAISVGFLAILAWGAYQLQSRSLVSTTRSTAVVSEVKQFHLGKASTGERGSGGNTFYRVRLMFEDSTWVELPASRPLPEVGDRLPVIVEWYDDGSKFYAIDWTAWRTGRIE